MYDIYSNAINIIRRQLLVYGENVVFHHYPFNDDGEIDYTQEPVTYSMKGMHHAGTGKMGASSAIRFAYMSDAGSGLGQMSDTGVLVLYDKDQLPQTGDICELSNYKFYVQVITDIQSAHKILDIALQVVGLVSP